MTKKFFTENFSEYNNLLSSEDLLLQLDSFKKLAESIKNTALQKGKIILFGNGGSDAQSSHFSTELLIRFKKDSLRPSIPAFAISSDSSVITACGNDFEFKYIFKKQLESILNENDCVIAFSTSGTSANIIEALNFGKDILNKNKIFLITGNIRSSTLEDFITIVRTPLDGDTETYQEFHLLLIHLVCNILEKTYV